MLGCLLISNSSNLALLWPVSKRAHLLIVMVFRYAHIAKHCPPQFWRVLRPAD
eukprot:COSAG02_NODE_2550_length_8554_cov_67.309639_5_plen_53_part_00